jgi:uncharacterized protein (TIGR02118 family)
MTIKLVVLYPRPEDEAEFEREYVGKHLPLMRELVGPDVPLPTYRTVDTPGRPAQYYRVAEIHFPDMPSFQAFAQSDRGRLGRESSLRVSSGGKPTFLVCEEQEQV